MNKWTCLIIGMLSFSLLKAQQYFPFPVIPAYWNHLTWAQWSPNDLVLYNSVYHIEGDTILKNIAYKKVTYLQEKGPADWTYLGGLREDANKNIYFFPAPGGLPTYAPVQFPSDTSEYLLYTFNNLQIGSIVPINQSVTQIEVVDIDSVLIDTRYHKRYRIQQGNLLGDDYWIEGIGSTKDLFAPYTYEFEWMLFTLCFTDTVTSYINAPFGADSCHYSVPIGIAEAQQQKAYVSPNPFHGALRMDLTGDILPAHVYLTDPMGKEILSFTCETPHSSYDWSSLPPGVYYLRILSGREKFTCKLLRN